MHHPESMEPALDLKIALCTNPTLPARDLEIEEGDRAPKNGEEVVGGKFNYCKSFAEALVLNGNAAC